MVFNEKEKTALATSVGADERQSVQNTNNIIPTTDEHFNDSGEIYEENLQEMFFRMSHPHYLHTVSMTELYQTPYKSRPPIIDGLLYSGTYLLAGAPKVGKSFLVAQLAYHTSAGLPLWDFPVKQCTVLYLALEDDYKRLQDRMFRMFGVESTENLFFATAAKQIGAGLEDQLELFIREHPNTQLIIIDTLQKIRELSGESYSYASDYEIIGKLKMFADKHGICLLLVHHTRKQPASDKFEMISGTTGLLGCADGAFLLQKERGIAMNATLDVVGRDQPEQKIFLVRDREHLNWTLDHIEAESTEQPPDPILEKVNTFLKDTWTGTPTDLVQLLEVGQKPNVLSRYLNVNKSRLENEYGIDYQNDRTHSGRIIVLNRTKLTP